MHSVVWTIAGHTKQREGLVDGVNAPALAVVGATIGVPMTDEVAATAERSAGKTEEDREAAGTTEGQ